MNPMFDKLELKKIYKKYFTSMNEIGQISYGYKDYEQSRSKNNMKKYYFDWFKKYAVIGGVVLDIGCGTGTFLECLKHESYKVYGLEVSNQAWKYLEEKKIPYFKVSTSKANLKKYDNIVLIDTLEHLNSPFKDLSKIYKSLKSGGFLFIETINIDPISKYPSLIDKWTGISPVHLFYWGEDVLINILTKIGFQIISIKKSPKITLKFFSVIINNLKKILFLLSIRKIFNKRINLNNNISFSRLFDISKNLQTIRIIAKKN